MSLRRADAIALIAPYLRGEVTLAYAIGAVRRVAKDRSFANVAKELLGSVADGVETPTHGMGTAWFDFGRAVALTPSRLIVVGWQRRYTGAFSAPVLVPREALEVAPNELRARGITATHGTGVLGPFARIDFDEGAHIVQCDLAPLPGDRDNGAAGYEIAARIAAALSG
ncbi:MAG: hypothetical protein JNK05_12590 [Myxococcales bacterium]|nr:hypothetical protein [Myxococcales bacterium]